MGAGHNSGFEGPEEEKYRGICHFEGHKHRKGSVVIAGPGRLNINGLSMNAYCKLIHRIELD